MRRRADGFLLAAPRSAGGSLRFPRSSAIRLKFSNLNFDLSGRGLPPARLHCAERILKVSTSPFVSVDALVRDMITSFGGAF